MVGQWWFLRLQKHARAAWSSALDLVSQCSGVAKSTLDMHYRYECANNSFADDQVR